MGQQKVQFLGHVIVRKFGVKHICEFKEVVGSL